MRIRLDPSTSVPLSAQLRDALARRIRDGRLAPGMRLPPVRTLAAELDLAPNTVARAYRELEAAGLLVGRGRQGTFVTDRLPGDAEDRAAAVERAAASYVARARQLGARRGDIVAAVRNALETEPPDRGPAPAMPGPRR